MLCREPFMRHVRTVGPDCEILSGMTQQADRPTTHEERAARPAATEDGVDRVLAQWRRERPDIDVDSVGIVTRMYRIARHLEKQRSQYLAEWDADRGTVDILGMLRRSGEPYRRTAGDLTKHSLITSGGVSQRLEKLERAGLVTRHVDTADRRRVEVQLTEQGVQLIDSVFGDVTRRDAATLNSVLDDHEQEALTRLLRKLLTSFEPAEDAGA